MRALPLAAIFALGCASPPPSYEPADRGATLYLVDTFEDVFDDSSHLYDPRDGAPRWLGEQAFALVLRFLGRRNGSRVLDRQDTELRYGHPHRFDCALPLDYVAPEGPVRFPHPYSLRVEFMPARHPDGAHADVDFKVTRRVGDALDLVVEQGARTIPLRTALLWWLPQPEGRVFLVLLHLAG